MQKLGVKYFCFHDVDLVPEADDIKETNRRLDEISDYILEKMKQTGIKCLWGTANMFSNPRFMNGAGSTNSADVYCFAAAQIKKALDLTVKFGGRGYVFWGGREGYETLLNTDVKFEQENIARLMRMAVDYGRSIGFKGDFYIEPKPKEPMKHQYDFDAATTTRAEMSRAVMEGVSFALRDCVEAAKEGGTARAIVGVLETVTPKHPEKYEKKYAIFKKLYPAIKAATN